MLCQVCVGVFQHRQGIRSNSGGWMNFSHHPNTSSFLAAAKEGCQICHALWKQYSQKEWQGVTVADEQREASVPRTFLTGSLNCFRRGDKLTISASVHTSDEYLNRNKSPLKSASFVFQPVKDSTLLTEPLMTASSTFSDESFTRAKVWIETCRTQHLQCGHRDNTWYPTRLLKISDLDDDEFPVRLVRTAQELPTTPYVTLSHRWGQVQLVQLLSTNMASFTKGIPLSDLPRTFRDALLAAKKLGIVYIWIDSLCIIQDRDDLSDWLREASLMHKVYAYSYCNLSASDANDSTEGLSRTRDPWVLQGSVEMCMKGLDDQQEYLPVSLAESDIWMRNIKWCPLNYRGWVFQERMLSPRILYFGREQLFWECGELEACETFPDSMPDAIRSSSAGAKFQDPQRYLEQMRAAPGAGNGDHLDIAEAQASIWSGMVKAYTSSALTMAGDKLIALSGIAQQLQIIFKDEYVAGMWRSRLVNDLTWNVSPRYTGVRPQEYRAPSWSWACVDEVIMTRNRFKPWTLLAAVEDVHLDHADAATTTGNLTGGYIDITGKLRHLAIAKLVGTGWVTVDGISYNPVQLDAKDQDTTEKGIPKKWVYGLALTSSTTNNELTVLLLICVDEQKNTYSRVGVANVSDPVHMERFLSVPAVETVYDTRVATIRVV